MNQTGRRIVYSRSDASIAAAESRYGSSTLRYRSPGRPINCKTCKHSRRVNTVDEQATLREAEFDVEVAQEAEPDKAVDAEAVG